MLIRQAADLQQSHVPVGMQHHDVGDVQQNRIRSSRLRNLPFEIDGGRLPRPECQTSLPPALSKQAGNMPVGHQQVFSDDEPGSGVGTLQVIGQLDPPHRRNGGLNSAFVVPASKRTPLTGRRTERVVSDVDHRSAEFMNDRFQLIKLFRPDISAFTMQPNDIQRLLGSSNRIIGTHDFQFLADARIRPRGFQLISYGFQLAVR